MSEESKEIGVQFKNIKETLFSNKLSDDIVNDFNHDNLELGLAFSLKGFPNEKSVALSLTIFYKYKIENKYKEFFKFTTETLFKFESTYDNVIKIEDSKVFVADELMGTLLSISIGATRGMMSYKVSNLPIDLVLPLFDISKLLPNLTK
ncbi:hypothetical protein E0I61_15585 [Flavobacterium ranwuense]|uniref:Uncharacterized protein n=1 Tax=Flavobacterium ranwuense TaxID=2541725 RepID=A0ABY2DMP9_9FLAO|nr:hypothetical protein [Flavobacterium ranwuense]TDE27067.1 hypothetical protein E0I61_15585 [Flavobacterium ranwuense]